MIKNPNELPLQTEIKSTERNISSPTSPNKINMNKKGTNNIRCGNNNTRIGNAKTKVLFVNLKKINI